MKPSSSACYDEMSLFLSPKLNKQCKETYLNYSKLYSQQENGRYQRPINVPLKIKKHKLELPYFINTILVSSV